MKKVIFILMALTLTLSASIASDVGKFPTDVTQKTVTVFQETTTVMPVIFISAHFEIAPVICEPMAYTMPAYNEKIVQLYVPPVYSDPDYGLYGITNAVKTYTTNRTGKQTGYAYTNIPTARHV